MSAFLSSVSALVPSGEVSAMPTLAPI